MIDHHEYVNSAPTKSMLILSSSECRFVVGGLKRSELAVTASLTLGGMWGGWLAATIASPFVALPLVPMMVVPAAVLGGACAAFCRWEAGALDNWNPLG